MLKTHFRKKYIKEKSVCQNIWLRKESMPKDLIYTVHDCYLDWLTIPSAPTDIEDVKSLQIGSYFFRLVRNIWLKFAQYKIPGLIVRNLRNRNLEIFAEITKLRFVFRVEVRGNRTVIVIEAHRGLYLSGSHHAT